MSISGLHHLVCLAGRCPGATAVAAFGPLCLAVPAPAAALVCGVVLAGGYALFSGWGVPAQRTVTMLAVVALQLSGAAGPWPPGVAAGLRCRGGADPWALWRAGFWLSFVAVGVLFCYWLHNSCWRLS